MTGGKFMKQLLFIMGFILAIAGIALAHNGTKKTAFTL